MKKGYRNEQKLTRDLEAWLREGKPRTVQEISEAFPEKSYAILILVLMLLPATPLPTGGVTHVFEIIAMLVSLQLVVSKRTLWLPRRFKELSLSGKTLVQLSRAVHKLNRLEIKFLAGAYTTKFQRPVGALIFIFVAGAFLAPPFSGLDTLPALGAVLMSVGLILESLLIIILGLVVGAAGVAVEVVLGRLVLKLL